MLALGGTLAGTAAAYQIYRVRSEGSLASLKRGHLVSPAAIVAAATAPAPSATAAPATNAAATEAATSTAATTPDGSLSATSAPANTAPATAVTGDEPLLPAFPLVAQDIAPELVPVSLSIPAIGLRNARVVKLGTHFDSTGALVWETADHAVGYHMGTGTPGKKGNAVFSGHISSPVRGEGNIFHNLPNLADNLNALATVTTADGTTFTYRIQGTDVVQPTDVTPLYPTPTAVMTLITCVPDGVYTHRFIAQGVLVA